MPNDYITEYGGEVIDKKEAERRRGIGKATHIRSVSFGHTAIDGINVRDTSGDGGASFANDPRSVEQVNAKFVVVSSYAGWGVKRTGLTVPERVLLRATKTIAVGEEVYVDYGRDYWDNHG